MDEKTELSSDPSTEILEPVDSTLEEGIDEQPTLETKSIDTNEDAGTSEQVETTNEVESEPNNDLGNANTDENTLISELNDVPLSTTVNSVADSFLESFTSENIPGDTETQISEEPNVENTDTGTPDESADMSMPSLTLTEEPSSLNFVNLENKSEETVDTKDDSKDDVPKDVTNKEKDTVCSLEEELQRMHEGDSVLEPVKDIKEEEDKVGLKAEGPDAEVNKTENLSAPIMKDSDLEEMLSAEEVMQDPLAIKSSQEELKYMDILVCGSCHEVFYLVEEFQEHKLKKCNKISKVLPSCMLESKSQVWAFALWKSKQVKLQSESGTSRTQWELYKDWCTLAQTDKDPWISAGETLQYCQKLGTAKLTEIKVQKAHADGDKDPLSLDGFEDSNKENSSFDNSKSPLLEVKRTVINKPKAVPTIQKANNDANSNKAMRTVQTKDKSEYAVEKIVAKRFNPKKKTLEYQIKWEHFSSEDNTWEPLANLIHCKQMVDEFEEQLKKLKAEKAKQQAMSLAKNSPKLKSGPVSSSPASSSSLISSGPTGNRPQRTSKQKALDQVKAWCGNISDDENMSGIKRSRSPDSDESFEKRLKFDDLSDDSEPETKPKIQFRKIAPKPSSSNTPVQVLKNGIGKNSPLPQNILIPDANGVVRINQKQLPSLSTGVYIMSKTAGIIKLDSDTSKVATSGGQTIVKVAPKIGQTQIKIMKKDGTSTQRIVQMSPKNIPAQKAMKTHLARAQKLVTEIRPSHQVIKRNPEMKKPILNKSDSEKRQIPIKKLPELVPKQAGKVTSKSKDSNQKEEESDDGLEELPFPDEIKIPEPEEESSEFTLDPETGKIAGIEYPDPEPEPEPTEETKSDSSLDNIVKLAAADITEEDLKNEPQEAVDIEMHNILEEEEDEAKIIKTEPQHMHEKRFATASPMKPVVKMSVTPRKVAANPTSILNKALTGSSHVVRRTVVGGPTQRLQQKNANPSINRNSQMASPVVRQVNTYVRTKPTAPKPKFNVASEPPKFIRPNHNTSPKNVYSYSRQVVQNSPSQPLRKIGNTTVRNSPMMGNQQKMQSKLVRTSTGVVQRIVSPARKEPVLVRGQPERIERKIAPQKPKTVISMPSLMSDDELLITKTPQKRKQPPSPIQISAPEVNEQEQMMEQQSAVIETPMITHQESEQLAAEAVATLAPDMSSFTLADNENPIFITGDDGTVYQVAGQNEQGQTILLTQGSDGQQQCLLVTNEVAEAMDTSPEEVAQAQPEISIPEISPEVTEPLSVKTDQVDSSDQVVAQVVRAEPPSPGGTHKVVVMLPDGNLMVTQVSPEEYASLELD